MDPMRRWCLSGISKHAVLRGWRRCQPWLRDRLFAGGVAVPRADAHAYRSEGQRLGGEERGSTNGKGRNTPDPARLLRRLMRLRRVGWDAVAGVRAAIMALGLHLLDIAGQRDRPDIGG
jgi:hypothetical protein